MVTTMGSSTKGKRVARPRTKQVDKNDPRGQLGLLLRHWLDTHPNVGLDDFAQSLGVTRRAVAKWCEGESAPDLLKLDLLAKRLGYADWSKLASAAVRHAKQAI